LKGADMAVVGMEYADKKSKKKMWIAMVVLLV
jgi:hypothetical protein